MTFFSLFFAVLAALLVRDWLRGIKIDVLRHNAKCKREAAHYNKLMNEADKDGRPEVAEQYAQQYRYWTKGQQPYKFLGWWFS